MSAVYPSSSRQVHSDQDYEPSPSPSPPPTIIAPKPIRRNVLPPFLPTHPASQPVASSSKSPKPPSRPPSRTERRYKCTHSGCDKAYFKPSRLAEHELSHTGERPHKCPECALSYLRASHLHAHMRTHLPKDAKPFTCEREGCGKTFWTATHLRRHEEMHDRAEVYPCEQCEQTFSKAHLLREHVALAHMPEGTKPFPCTYEGCEASFAVKAKLKAHEKTHDPTRYTCSHPSHGTEFPSFPVWSALQTHIHQAHPPTCPHEECKSRTFKSLHQLKVHLKVHADQETDRALLAQRQADGTDGKFQEVPPIIADGLTRRAKRRRQSALDSGDIASSALDGGKSPKLRRVNSGETGKDWACEHEDCEKRFKTRAAMETHRRAIHLKERNHVCPEDGCGKAFPHRVSLVKHLEAHARRSASATGEAVDEGARSAPASGSGSGSGYRPPATDGQALTGNVRELRRFGCPSYVLQGIMAGAEMGSGLASTANESETISIGGLPVSDSVNATSTLVPVQNTDVDMGMAEQGQVVESIVKTEKEDDQPGLADDLIDPALRTLSDTTAGNNDALALNTTVIRGGDETHDAFAPEVAYIQASGEALGPQSETQEAEIDMENRCYMRFWRVYDVRRHLKAEHGIELDDMEVRKLLLSTGHDGA